MEKTASSSDLKGILKTNQKTMDFSLENVRERIEELLSQPLIPAEQNKIYGMLSDFICLHFVYQLSQKYPLISNEIFNLKRTERMRLKSRNGSYQYDVELPSIVKLPFEQSNDGRFTLETKGGREGYGALDDVEISCSVPEITSEARIAFSDSVKFCAELTSEAYKDQLLSRILVRGKVSGRNLSGPLNSKYSLVWAPSTWNAKVIEKDPAIFMRYFRRNFLISQWEVPNERSLEGMLRNFKEDFPDDPQLFESQ